MTINDRHGMVFIMTQNEVLKELLDHDINISVRTLQRYVEWGLIPKPNITRKGRAGGTKADYPPHTPAEIYAALLLINDSDGRFKVETVRNVREIALYLEKLSYSYKSPYDILNNEKIKSMVVNELLGVLIWMWLDYKYRFLYGKRGDQFYKEYIDTYDEWKKSLEKDDSNKANQLKKEIVIKRQRSIITNPYLELGLMFLAPKKELGKLGESKKFISYLIQTEVKKAWPYEY
jgi:hypothetical protein